MLETDAPYFRPQYKGVLPEDYLRFAFPLQVVLVAAQVAEVKGLRLEDVLLKCRENVSRIYRIQVPVDKEEAVAVVCDLLDEVIGNITYCNILPNPSQSGLKRCCDIDNGLERKSLKTMDHLVIARLDPDAKSFIPGGQLCHEGSITVSESCHSDLVGQILDKVLSRVVGRYGLQVWWFL